MSAEDISKDTYKKHYYDWQRPLRKAEVACYFSHRSAWDKVIKSKKPALILEDDAEFMGSKNKEKIVTALNWLKNNRKT